MNPSEKVAGWWGFLRRLNRYRHLETARVMHRSRLGFDLAVSAEGHFITIDPPGITIDMRRNAFYFDSPRLVRILIEESAGAFVMNEEGNPEYRVGNARIVPEGGDDLYMLEETFSQGQYEMPDDGREWFVLDIGMNVAVVALYFAGVKGWEVIGYEPFPTTFDIARRNVERSGLQDRVHMRNAGVDGGSGHLKVLFNKESRSTNSLFGNISGNRRTPDEEVEIRLMDAADVVEEALQMAGERPLLSKIDCEGAEYAIFDRLIERNLLERVDAFLIEYHYVLPEHSPERIRKPLLERGYRVTDLWGNSEAGGLIAISERVRI